ACSSSSGAAGVCSTTSSARISRATAPSSRSSACGGRASPRRPGEWKFERARAHRLALTQTPTLHEQSGGIRMSVATGVEDRVSPTSTTDERLFRVALTVGSQEISFETGKLPKQADGAVVVRSGETMVLATAQGRMETREGADFFPLTVDVEERMYAAGKIPGGFFKREGRP